MGGANVSKAGLKLNHSLQRKRLDARIFILLPELSITSRPHLAESPSSLAHTSVFQRVAFSDTPPAWAGSWTIVPSSYSLAFLLGLKSKKNLLLGACTKGQLFYHKPMSNRYNFSKSSHFQMASQKQLKQQLALMEIGRAHV